MPLRFVLFILWVALVFAGCLIASYYAWSPYSSEQRHTTAHGIYGPTHK
ncbi:hypothetical protein WSK_0109 [Novosphingobium sp. Rr 2-17]|nr:hypothetical protein [Novosphingobium sp. Rr 2-17]EIZ81164.1 hypothetical protein WSK_0109 [Novosphingobium sp. Rr 2-17]